MRTWLDDVPHNAVAAAVREASHEIHRMRRCGCPKCSEEADDLTESWRSWLNAGKRIVYLGEGNPAFEEK